MVGKMTPVAQFKTTQVFSSKLFKSSVQSRLIQKQVQKLTSPWPNRETSLYKSLSSYLHVNTARANKQQGIAVPHINMQRLSCQVLKKQGDLPWFHVGWVKVVAYLHRV